MTLEQQGKEFERIFSANEVNCALQECTENILVERYEFDLKPLTLSSYKQIKKVIELMAQCLHKKISQVDSEKHHFAIEVRKENTDLNLLDYNDKYKTGDFQALIGLDYNNCPVVFDLKKSVHTLIGGSTGMGKTNIINDIIYSLTSKNTSDELQLYIIDIKKTLKMWEKLPHLADEIITDPYDALDAFDEISDIMEDRHELLAQKKLSKAPKGLFPQIVIIIDELADLMLSDSAKWLEKEIMHIAQLGRSVNISLILATQNPIVKVCTSNIKANCPTRIALKTISYVNSKVILDDPKLDASKLDGVGYAIMRCAGDATNYNFKAFCLTDEQIQNYIKGEK